MISNPLISVITPTLNSEATIEGCLRSVANQTFKNIEHIIIDGISSDLTLDIIKKYKAEYSNIRLISERDIGIYDAMNKGIDLSNGEWLIFLGSDDTLYDENVFLSLLNFLSDSKLEVVYGNVIFKVSGEKYDGKFNRIKLIQRNICHQAILTRKRVFNKIGKFDIQYKSLADWHFNMKWFNNSKIKHKYTDRIIANYYENGYCFNNLDLKFGEDWDRNVADYFPLLTRIIYRLECGKLFGKIIKTYLE